MSSTNRGAIRSDYDFYMTSPATIRTFLQTFITYEPDFKIRNSRLFDACAGGNKLHDMPYPLVLREMGAKHIDTMDIRPDSRADIIADYLQARIAIKYDGIFINPPYVHCLQFIEKALTDVRRGGYVGVLVRLNFLGSIKRKLFFQQCMPKWCFVHSARPKFNGNRSDSTEYAHLVWQKGFNRTHSKLIVI